MTQTTADNNAIRPFQMTFVEAELTELRNRINATKWPERETVTNATQGVLLARQKGCASRPIHGMPLPWHNMSGPPG